MPQSTDQRADLCANVRQTQTTGVFKCELILKSGVITHEEKRQRRSSLHPKHAHTTSTEKRSVTCCRVLTEMVKPHTQPHLISVTWSNWETDRNKIEFDVAIVTLYMKKKRKFQFEANVQEMCSAGTAGFSSSFWLTLASVMCFFGWSGANGKLWYIILNVSVGTSGGLSLICTLTLSDNLDLVSVPTKVPEEISPVTVRREWMCFKSALLLSEPGLR